MGRKKVSKRFQNLEKARLQRWTTSEPNPPGLSTVISESIASSSSESRSMPSGPTSPHCSSSSSTTMARSSNVDPNDRLDIPISEPFIPYEEVLPTPTPALKRKLDQSISILTQPDDTDSTPPLPTTSATTAPRAIIDLDIMCNFISEFSCSVCSGSITAKVK